MVTVVAGICLSATDARAGIPECGGLRLESVGSCEIRGDLDCSASCEDLGIYKKACATKLHTVCRDVCTLDPEPTCTDECTEQCSQDCDRGVNVICIHNCFGECAGSCSASCEGADDVTQCMATCEATCDGECDIQCEAVVEGSCYQHCIECCGGSCGAQANMTCQQSCQEEEFETCEYEFRAECEGSCTGDGALFCDGEYVLSGEQMGPCFDALIRAGIEAVDLTFDVDLDGGVTGFCAVDRTWDRGGAVLGALGLLFGVARIRRAAHREAQTRAQAAKQAR